MNLSTRVCLLFVVAFVCGSQCRAQQDDPGILQSPNATFEGKFAVMKNGDTTIVTLPLQKAGGDTACGLFVAVGYMYKGKLTENPKRIWFSLVRDTTDEPKLLTSPAERELTLTMDGKDLILGAMPSVKQVLIGYSLMQQGLMIYVPYETFSQIANAKKVNARLGTIKFNLTDKTLADFRDLIKRISKEKE